MLSKLIVRSFQRFGLTKFDKEINEKVLPTAPQLNKPQVISTEDREKYRHQNKIRHKRTPVQLKSDWTRDFHNRVYTEK